MSYRKLDDLVKFISNKNTDGNASVLFGINIDKFFMPSVANIIGVDLTKYKVVKKHQFACNRMHVGRDKILPISMSNLDYDFIVSPAYDVFEVTSSEVLPDYLMLWFKRKEFDRQCWFYTDADVRGGLHLDALKTIEIKVPSIDEQIQIISQYQVVADKIKVNQQICLTLEATAQALYKHWFVDFEFPDENGKPYKSSGGKMIWNEELEKEIPIGWNISSLNAILDFSDTRINLKSLNKDTYISTENMLFDKRGVESISKLPIGTNVTQFLKGDILISNIRPYLKKIWMADRDGGCSNDVLCLRAKENDLQFFALNILWNDAFFDYVMQGAKGTKMPRGDKNWIMNYQIVLPTNTILEQFAEKKKYVNELAKLKSAQNQKLTQLQSLLLSRLATIEKNQLEYA